MTYCGQIFFDATLVLISRIIRSLEIDVLRGFAIISILMLHAGLMTPGLDEYPKILPLVQRLSTGMQLFFVLSGYLVADSLDRCISNGEGVNGFLLRRAAKLLPLYFIFLHVHIGLFFIAQQLAPDVQPFRNSPTSENVILSNYMVHLLLLQGFTPTWLHTLLDGSWSIVNEAYFYLILAFSPKLLWHSSLFVTRLYAASIGLAILFILLIGRHYDGYSHYGFFSQLPCFILGVLVQKIKITPGFHERFTQWNSAVFTAAILLMVGLAKGASKPLGDSNIYALCFAALLLSSGVMTRILPEFVNKVLANFGRKSYALFLVHLVLLKSWYFLMASYSLEINFQTAILVNIFIALPLSWLLSKLFIDPIDRYFVARADSLLKQHKFQHPNR